MYDLPAKKLCDNSYLDWRISKEVMKIQHDLEAAVCRGGGGAEVVLNFDLHRMFSNNLDLLGNKKNSKVVRVLFIYGYSVSIYKQPAKDAHPDFVKNKKKENEKMQAKHKQKTAYSHRFGLQIYGGSKKKKNEKLIKKTKNF